jgi:phi LC3 family holin
VKKLNLVTLVPALLGAIKLILEPFGVHISNEDINAIANGVAAIVTIVGVVVSHQKAEVQNSEK